MFDELSFSSADELLSHYATVRSRLMGKPPARIVKPIIEFVPPMVVNIIPPKYKPVPLCEPKPACRALQLPPLLIDMLPLVQANFRKHGVRMSDIRSHRRDPKFSAARFELYFILECKGYSLKGIGRMLNRDHSSIHNGIHDYLRDHPEATRSVNARTRSPIKKDIAA